MRKVSLKQAKLNRELYRLKSLKEKICVICGNEAHDHAHLLPKSLYPEYYTEPRNLVIMCRTHHNKFDNDIEFRQKQIELFDQAYGIDKKAARKYFRL